MYTFYRLHSLLGSSQLVGNKVSLCKNCQRQRLRHSLAYLSVQKRFTEEVPYYVKIWPKLTNPFQKRKNAHFQSIFAHSASAVKTSEKVQLTRIGSLTRVFH